MTITHFCRHCKQDMFLHGIQEYPAKYNLAPIVEIHCTNPGCPLWLQTFDAATYAEKDLTPYLRGKEVKLWNK